MTRPDPEWAIAEIGKFIHVTDQIALTSGPGIIRIGSRMRGSQVEAAAAAHVVELILDRVMPGWRRERPEGDGAYQWLRGQAARAKAQIEREDELVDKLGDDAPEMDASNLHPWAWENGRSYWNTGHHHQAVMQAAMRINSEAQAKLDRRDVSETYLFNQAFSLDEPKPGAPRLRLAENDGSKTYESIHRGARAFAEGLYSAIRNPGMHVPQAGGEEQLALEQLAAFSLLARWVDQATVVGA